MKPVRVAVVTNVLPHYRRAFYQRVFERPELDVQVFCQAAIPGMNLDLVHDLFPGRVTIVPAFCLARERAGWQWLPWGRLLSGFDVLFVSGNPRVLSNVVVTGLARAAGRRVILWGQTHTADANRWSERLRLWWWRGFDLLVYTDREAGWLRGRGFRGRRIVGMNNGLDQDRIEAAVARWDEARLQAWRRDQGLDGRTLLLACARLEPKNEFGAWLDAMPLVIRRHPDLLWCVIGDGSERRLLEVRARESGIERSVRWLGAILDEDQLAPWFLSSRALVHPGAIGLTLLHSFGYGLPVVTHDDPEGHMPEFGAFVPGETGWLHRRGDAEGLAEAVCRCLEDEAGRVRMAERVRRIVREDFNVNVMVGRFVEMAL